MSIFFFSPTEPVGAYSLITQHARAGAESRSRAESKTWGHVQRNSCTLGLTSGEDELLTPLSGSCRVLQDWRPPGIKAQETEERHLEVIGLHHHRLLFFHYISRGNCYCIYLTATGAYHFANLTQILLNILRITMQHLAQILLLLISITMILLLIIIQYKQSIT